MTEPPLLDKDQPVQILYEEQDITKLVLRAQTAIKTIENIRIVGPTVSGDPQKGFAIH